MLPHQATVQTFLTLHVHSRVTVVCLCVCLSVTTLTARTLPSAVQSWHQWKHYYVLNLWILLKVLCSKVMPSFTSSIGSANTDNYPKPHPLISIISPDACLCTAIFDSTTWPLNSENVGPLEAFLTSQT